MKILIIEDIQSKIDDIQDALQSIISEGSYTTEVVNTFHRAGIKLNTDLYDLIIFDIYLPLNDPSQTPVDISKEILEDFSNCKNSRTESLALTAYEITDIENITAFNESGVTVVEYSNDTDKWLLALELKIQKIQSKVKYEFIIFCALEKERQAFAETSAKPGKFEIKYGLNCQHLEINNMNGLLITPPSMGLVNMGILASKAIELFQPKLVAMSGICAGLENAADFLDIIVADTCWEYQTGKYNNGKFQQEPYQSPIENSLKTELQQFISNLDINTILPTGIEGKEAIKPKVILAPMSSGSAVIADEKVMSNISEQHRKMAGLEMEMYAMYEAARQSTIRPLYFGAKSVVDLGDNNKSDQYQSTACILSARFVTNFIAYKLS